jgi:mRNA-degrading endonuclease RelE of RelBE toxin-antitoxin system
MLFELIYQTNSEEFLNEVKYLSKKELERLSKSIQEEITNMEAKRGFDVCDFLDKRLDYIRRRLRLMAIIDDND